MSTAASTKELGMRRLSSAKMDPEFLDRMAAVENPSLLKAEPEVNWSALFLEQIPSFKKLTSVETMSFNISNNEIKKIPDLHRAFPNLTFLDIGKNEFQVIPGTVMKLKPLVHLRCYQNQIKKIPTDVTKLVSLIELNVFDNNIKTLPTKLEKLVNLTELNISSNPIKQLPSLAGLKKLQTLVSTRTNPHTCLARTRVNGTAILHISGCIFM
jgi:hypothetical protein